MSVSMVWTVAGLGPILKAVYYAQSALCDGEAQPGLDLAAQSLALATCSDQESVWTVADLGNIIKALRSAALDVPWRGRLPEGYTAAFLAYFDAVGQALGGVR